MSVIEIDRTEQIPVRLDGMFILLEGEVKVKTHWRLKEGLSPAQQYYSTLTRGQQGRMREGYN